MVVASFDVHLEIESAINTIFLLELSAGQNAAGGRFGGFGQRGLDRVLSFTNTGGAWRKEIEIFGSENLVDFEPPYHAAAMPITLGDGTEIIVAGVVDDNLVVAYNSRFKAQGN